MSAVAQRTVRKLLLVGLDGSGKTTLIKQFKNDVQPDNAEMIMTTPFIAIEMIKLPLSNTDCLVYDMSGQVSFNCAQSHVAHSFVPLPTQGRYRESWSFFYPEVDGIFFVVDSSDYDRLTVA